MGLLTIIKKQKIKDKEIRVLILGLDNAGKTTIIKQLLGEDTSKISPTMGFQINSLQYNGFNLNVWDIGGQTTIRHFWSNYFDRSNVIVWVVDALSLERLDESFEELRDKIIRQDQLVGTYLAVLVNKVDVLSAQQQADVRRAVEQKLQMPADDLAVLGPTAAPSLLDLGPTAAESEVARSNPPSRALAPSGRKVAPPRYKYSVHLVSGYTGQGLGAALDWITSRDL